MPGFKIANYGANRGHANAEARFYATYTWEIPNLFTNGPRGMPLSGGSVGNQSRDALPLGGYPKGYSNDRINVLLKSAQLPSISLEKIKATGGSHEYNFAGKPVFESIRVSMYDTVGLIDFLKEWKNSVWDKSRGLRTANYYKKNTSIVKYPIDRPDLDTDSAPDEDPNISTLGEVKYDLFGSWPSSIKDSELSYAESSIKYVDVVITYDYFEIT